VSARGLGKLYFICERESYTMLRDGLTRALTAPLRLLKGKAPRTVSGLDAHTKVEFIWAVKDASFDLKQGEVVGIIGSNGSGKSTLLKIISRITEPTEGEARIYGRVGSLLEVGTGFHPELSGRENIYLNGAILGMRKAEIDRQFNAIVEFAEIEKFLDMPVKHYSSGMYTRLAFSVAAHLDPEILVVDEVLAVGDAAFQKKCLGKMGDVAKAGRTVLFVSHNMAVVENLCSRAIWLDSGRIQADGLVGNVVAKYIQSLSTRADQDLSLIKREGALTPVIRKIEFLDESGLPATTTKVGSTLFLRVHYRHTEPLKNAYFGLRFETASGINVFWLQTRMQNAQLPDVLPASGIIECRIPELSLVPGLYFLTPGCGSGNTQLDVVPKAGQLQVVESDFFGTGKLPPQSLGLVVVDAAWEAVG